MSNCSEQVKSNHVWNVLVCDFDRICLRILEKMLRTCNYQVTACQNAETAIKLLKEENNFDIIMVDVYIPDMDGLEFIKHICEQRDLPLIAMSCDDDEEVIKEGFKAGACDYLVKPIRIETVRHVWMNVYRAQRHVSIKREQSWSSSVTMINESDSGEFQKINATSQDEEDIKCVKKRKSIMQTQRVDYANTATKKQRVVWTPELHHKFVAAVTQFRNSKAVPKKILELMNVPGLTRENVASHLQKYRQYLKRVEQQNCHTLELMSSKEECFHEHNIQAQVIPTSSLQVRGHPFDQVAANDVDRQMLCFQPHHAMGQIANTTDINLAAIVEGSNNNVIYHPLASKMNSKIHVDETPCIWSTYSMEDDLKKEANTSIGGQQFGNNYAYENVIDFGYNHASPYIQQLDHHNAYGCNSRFK